MKLVIGELIEKSGLKKKYICEQLQITRHTLKNWIEGKTFPRLDQAVQLADLLQCKVDDLYERDSND
ncbi:helix-turn-helix transcriptional regulator [Virgibacillus halophilus]|uniref:Helix-turn-helix transcriptional regulator n=1 Tax=Tigheibacillus halophilus TaxID=361280 RepID=A0ABU5CBP9_9BACI|nr:helix-turn-helix transcriptional regulator [Virgibacillus halophilus]